MRFLLTLKLVLSLYTALSLAAQNAIKINDLPEYFEVRAGFTASFHCTAVSDPPLHLTFNWLKNGQQIDFEKNPRFIVKSSNTSMTISKTEVSDSGTYTCVASTELASAQENMTFSVQDVPNPPWLKGIICKDLEANLAWEPRGDNGAPIRHYSIQYNTNFTHDSWVKAAEHIPATESTYTIALSPSSNYIFSVIAWNKLGESQPSYNSQVCTTRAAVP